MSEIQNVQKDILLARSELKNIRQAVMKIKAKQKQEAADIKLLLSNQDYKEEKERTIKDQNEDYFNMVPIGFISSCFKNKNGIPRQPSLCQASKASLEINKTFFTNPEHSLIGLSEFSYVWILFVFHKNAEKSVKAKVHPPRLNGRSVGVFSTRSPHRPCAIGLSLTKLENISGSTMFLSGVDILDGTPVLDIKPYIPSYDVPMLYKNTGYFFDENTVLSKNHKDSLTSTESSAESANSHTFIKQNLNDNSNIYSNDSKDKSADSETFQIHSSAVSVGELLKLPSNLLEVLFTERAMKNIEKFHFPSHNPNCEYCLDLITNHFAAKQAIVEILQNDPRSVYRKDKCSDKLYFFEIDKLHVTCWFDDTIAEVLRIRPVKKCNSSTS